MCTRLRALTVAVVPATVLLATLLLATPAGAGPGRAPATFPTDRYPVDGVDVASWQHPGGAPIDWAWVRRAGVDFATVKATEGSPADHTAYANPYFAADRAGARAQGMPVAPYHFYLGRTPGTGAAQADFFLSVVRAAGYTGRQRGDLPPILDFEWDWRGGCPPYGTVADARAWLDRVRSALRRTPVIYTSRTFVLNCLAGSGALGGYRLQVADYTTAPGHPLLPPGWTAWWMWQWTARGCVDGVPTCNLTRTVYAGTRGDLLRAANR